MEEKKEIVAEVTERLKRELFFESPHGRLYFHEGVGVYGEAQDSDKLVEDLANELFKLQGVIKQHALCHDSHGKVDAVAFNEGCVAEQRKLYGRAPDRDTLSQINEVVRELGFGQGELDEDLAGCLRQGLDRLRAAQFKALDDWHERRLENLAQFMTDKCGLDYGDIQDWIREVTPERKTCQSSLNSPS